MNFYMFTLFNFVTSINIRVGTVSVYLSLGFSNRNSVMVQPGATLAGQ